MTFLIVWWVLCFITLLATVVLLHFIYRWRGSDLGLMPWGKEIVLAAFASFLQAGIYAVVMRFGMVHWSQWLLGFLAVMFCYKLGHLADMGKIELVVIAAVQRAFIACVLLLLM
jgi:predicted AlkP superfamily pyrophosphatase or phosphodiesterase